MSLIESLFNLELVDSVLSARYLSAVALVSVVYDHFLTLDQEFSNIWGSGSSQGYLHKFTFALNRYVAEAVTAYTAFGAIFSEYWTILRTSTQTLPSASNTNFNIIDAEHLFGYLQLQQQFSSGSPNRKRMTFILFSGFSVSISTATVLAILTVIKAQPVTFFFPVINTCGFLKIPSTLPYVLGILLLFDSFLIAIAVLNAFEATHHTHAEVFKSLHRDGARLFLVLFVLRLVTLLMSIIGNPADTFAVLR
ncbi:hypothetical protein D9758_016353 [Tetrapyrgos nigripes]|uniref:DUF6533 domain-containing protein n=1 Tax=Tetrapyrgos nigripes TaxID=182062 RepID=A0A8H5BXM7_9AGAR|nr:hypothetical protein D9758_016353 [Tetrapyrgos nigripes]